MNNNNQSHRFGFLPRYVSWLTIVLALLAIITFFAISNPSPRYYDYAVPMMEKGGIQYDGGGRGSSPSAAPTSIRETGVSSAPAEGNIAPDMYYPYPYPNPDVPVTDTREFLKTYYNASMRTRDVQGLTRSVATIVRGHDGRVDQESSSLKYGNVSFAVPQSKFDSFRIEVEGLVGSRFLSVNVLSQNLLPQKVSIEEQQKQADETLATYIASRQKIVSDHASAVQSLQKKIDADTRQLATLRAASSTPQILLEMQTVANDLAVLKRQLENENASYTRQLSYADNNIKYAEKRQEAVQKQDQALIDSVATVTGTVSLQWISYWDMARLYLPDYWIPTIFAFLALLSFLNDRRRFQKMV
jgi:hypothetical protein